MASISGVLGSQRAASNLKKLRDDPTGIGPVIITEELAAESEAANIVATICTTPPSQRSQDQIERLIQTLLAFPFFGQLPESSMYTFSKHATLANVNNGQEIRFDVQGSATSLKPVTPSSLMQPTKLGSILPVPPTPMRRVWLFLLQGAVSQYALKEVNDSDGLFASSTSKKIINSFLAGDCLAIDPRASVYTEADSLACMLVVPESAFGDMSRLIMAYSSFRSFFCSRPCERSLKQIHIRHKELQRAFPHSEFLKDLSAQDALGLLRYARWSRPEALVPVYIQGTPNTAAFFVLSGTVEYLHQPQGTEVDVQGFNSGTATLKKAFGKPWSKPLLVGDVVGDIPSAVGAPAPRSTNEHTAVAMTCDVILLRFDVDMFRKYESCNGIFDPDALCHLLKKPAAARSSNEVVALCNLMETVSFCKVIPPDLMFEWCRLLEFESFHENDILQEQNSFQFSEFAVFVIISGTLHEHAQADIQDPDFFRFKEYKEHILPLQKDEKTAKALTSATRTECFGPYIRSIGVGDVFGDRGILGKRCRQTTVIADSSTVRCMKITRKKFSEFTKLMPSLAAQPEVVWQLIQTHADRRSEQERNELLVQLQRLPAFSALPPDAIADIAAASRGGSFNTGDMVFPVDDESRFFGIILEGEMASFCRDDASIAAFPGMQVHTFEASNKVDQERYRMMQQRYGTLLQKFSHGSIVGVGALWLPETSCVARLDSAALVRGKSLQDSASEGIPTVYETIAAKGSRVRRIMSFVSMSKGLQVIIVDSHSLTMAKAILKNTESFIPTQLLAALERPPHLRSAHEHLSITAYLLTFKYCQRLPAATVSDFAKHVEVSLRKKGECVQRQGVKPTNFIMPLKGSVSLFRVPPPPHRDDDDDDDDIRWGDGERSVSASFEGDHERLKNRSSREGSPGSKGRSSRHGSKRLSPSPPRTGALVECAVPSTADTDQGALSTDDGEDFAGIFGDKIGSVSVGAPIDELALVMNALSPFTAVVTSHVARLFILPPFTYAKLLQRFHKEELSKLCKDIIQSVPVFRSWALPKVMNLIRYFEPREYFRGQKIMSQLSNRRNEQRRIILILEGSCAVEADLPRSSEHTLESDIKLRQKEEQEDQSLRELALSNDSSPKAELRKLRHLKRAVITVFGKSTVLLDGFAPQSLCYDIVAIERVACLELSGEEFNKISNSTLEYIAEQEAMTNSWRSSVVAKLAVIRAPDFSLIKSETDVDVDSIVAAMNAKKKAELRAAKERYRSPKNRENRRSPEPQSGLIEGLAHLNGSAVSRNANVLFGQRVKIGPRSCEATLSPSSESINRDPVSCVMGHTVYVGHANASNSLLEGNNWWLTMGIEEMEGKGYNLERKSSTLPAPSEFSNVIVNASSRESARATFGVKPVSFLATKKSDLFLKEARHKQALEKQSAQVETSLGEWSRKTNKSSTIVINTPDGKLHSMQLSQVARASRLSMTICGKGGSNQFQ